MFNIKKIVTVLCMLTKELGRLDKGKVCKILYYIDKIHLIEYGRFVSGDRYYKLPMGPIPTRILDILNDKEMLFPEEQEYLSKYLSISKDKKKYIECKREPDYTELSMSEKKVIKRVIKEYGHYSFPKLVDISHDEPAYIKAKPQEELSIYDMISDLPNDQKREVVEILKSQKETEKFLVNL